jgi:hypothetical protein
MHVKGIPSPRSRPSLPTLWACPDKEASARLPLKWHLRLHGGLLPLQHGETLWSAQKFISGLFKGLWEAFNGLTPLLPPAVLSPILSPLGDACWVGHLLPY